MVGVGTVQTVCVAPVRLAPAACLYPASVCVRSLRTFVLQERFNQRYSSVQTQKAAPRRVRRGPTFAERACLPSFAVFSPAPPNLPVAVSERRLLRARGDVRAGGHRSPPPTSSARPLSKARSRTATTTPDRSAATHGRVGASRCHLLPAVQQACRDGRCGARCAHGPTRRRRRHLVGRGRSTGGGERRVRAGGDVRRGVRPTGRGRRPSRPCR